MEQVLRLGMALLVGAPLMIGGSLVATAASAATWQCSAKNLINFRYTGGKSAMIHLSPYPDGGTYRVTKVSATQVTGKTKNGTVFTCVLQ